MLKLVLEYYYFSKNIFIQMTKSSAPGEIRTQALAVTSFFTVYSYKSEDNHKKMYIIDGKHNLLYIQQIWLAKNVY